MGWRVAAVGAVLAGGGLRLWQYAARPSLWVDEAAVARNVLDRSIPGLFESLDYAQMAPPGFLLAVKASTLAFGDSELALRLFPLLAGLLGLPLFVVVANLFLSRVGTIVATMMFAGAAPLLYFSSNLKQYSSDVAVGLAVLFVADRLHRARLAWPSTVAFACTAAAALLVSQAAVFALTAAGAAVFLDTLASRREDRRLRLVVILVWAFSVLAAMAYGFASMAPADDAYLQRFWAHAFVARGGEGAWLWSTMQRFFGPPQLMPVDGSLHYHWPALFVVLAAIGSLALILRSPLQGLRIVGPAALVAAASAVHVYPMGGRVTLFLLPSLLILAVAGADAIGRLLLGEKRGQLAGLLLLPLSLLPLWRSLPPYHVEHLRPVMEYVSDHWESGDVLWVYYGAGQAFEYYRRSILVDADIHLGECARGDPRQYLRQLDLERGRKRVWILMAHDWAASGKSERRLLWGYLDAIGRKLDAFHAPANVLASSRAETRLYDLSQKRKLNSVSADDIELPEAKPALAWTCYGTMSAHGPSANVVKLLVPPLRRKR